MSQSQNDSLATQRAEEYAPRPKGGAVAAGACGVVLALLGDFVVSGFYGWSVTDNAAVAVGLASLGLAVGCGAYERRRIRNLRAVARELHKLDRRTDADPETEG